LAEREQRDISRLVGSNLIGRQPVVAAVPLGRAVVLVWRAAVSTSPRRLTPTG
jgi:hypothetical protein